MGGGSRQKSVRLWKEGVKECRPTWLSENGTWMETDDHETWSKCISCVAPVDFIAYGIRCNILLYFIVIFVCLPKRCVLCRPGAGAKPRTGM